jgi:hypothetical protein
MTTTPRTRWFLRWIATSVMLFVVFQLPGHHWFTEFLLAFAVLLLMNRRKLRPE